jgi:hypothetical protein
VASGGAGARAARRLVAVTVNTKKKKRSSGCRAGAPLDDSWPSQVK